MCLLRIPQHPWCDCANPTAVNALGKLTCTHHVWVDPSSVAHLKPDSLSHLDGKAYVETLLVPIHRPASAWQHCDFYRAFYTRSGTLRTGYELECLDTLSRKMSYEADCLYALNYLDTPSHKTLLDLWRLGRGHKEIYRWDGLCADCNRPGRCRGIKLPPVPLREQKHSVPVTSYDGPTASAASSDAFPAAVGGGEESWDEPVVGVYEKLDGYEIDKSLLKKMIGKGRKANGTGRGVFVDIVEVQKGVVNNALSAVYLLPGYYDPKLIREVENKEEVSGLKSDNGLKSAALTGVMMAGQLASRLVKERKLNGL